MNELGFEWNLRGRWVRLEFSGIGDVCGGAVLLVEGG